MSRFDSNYENVLSNLKEAGEDGVGVDEVCKDLDMDMLVVLACIKRGLKEGQLRWELDRLLYQA